MHAKYHIVHQLSQMAYNGCEGVITYEKWHFVYKIKWLQCQRALGNIVSNFHLNVRTVVVVGQ